MVLAANMIFMFLYPVITELMAMVRKVERFVQRAEGQNCKGVLSRALTILLSLRINVQSVIKKIIVDTAVFVLKNVKLSIGKDGRQRNGGRPRNE